MKLRAFLSCLLLLPLALAVSGCFWASEFETRHLTGHYYLDGASAKNPWYLYFKDEEGELGGALLSRYVSEAGFSEKCIVLRATGPVPAYYVIPTDDASARQEREFARSRIIGPLSKTEFQAKVRQLNNSALVPFDPDLTAF
jgi:hypothetical protein